MVIAGLGLGLGACGSGGHATSTAASPRTASAAAAPVAAGLKRFLLRAGEERNFPPSPGGGSFSTLAGWVQFTQLTAADARVLRSEGFVAAAQENVGDEGASFVEEFTSAEGARREAINDARESEQGGDRVVFFSVSGLANSHGVLISQPGEVGTDLYWTEGRCTLWLGNGAAVALRSQVQAAARAIDRRTDGTCP